MEVEIPTLQTAFRALNRKLGEYTQEVFYDAMKNEIEDHKKTLSYLVEEWLTNPKERKKNAEKMLREVAESMLNAANAMVAGIPSWELSICPMDMKEYDHVNFQLKVCMLHDFNNYMRALRDTNPKLLCKYFPYPVYFLNEIERVRTFYMADHAETEIWKGCMNLRKWLYNFEQRLDGVIKKK